MKYLTLLLLLSACVNAPVRWTYHRAGTPDSQLTADSRECYYRFARSSDSGPAIRQCMLNKGYTVEVLE